MSQQQSTAEGRSILGDLASLNLKSVGGGGEETEEEGESVVVDSGGIDMSLGKVGCVGIRQSACTKSRSRSDTKVHAV